jgi:hypothetical protein
MLMLDYAAAVLVRQIIDKGPSRALCCLFHGSTTYRQVGNDGMMG